MALENVWHLIGLGGIAGVIPIYVGLTAALLAMKVSNRSWEGFLTGIATGILVYLFFDLMHEAVEQTAAQDPLSWLVFLGSVLIGFVGLVAFEQHQGRNRSEAFRLSLPYMIALALGLHNLGEGLAIGASYAQGAWVLNGLLVGGFALHNGTEGFAIIASAGKSRLAVKDVVLMGLVAGLPTCVGAVISGLVVDRKSTRLNSSHGYISYAVFCLKKKKDRVPHRPHDVLALEPLLVRLPLCVRRVVGL